MVKRVWVVIFLFVALLGCAIWEQLFLQNSCDEMKSEICVLKEAIENEKLEESKKQAKKIEDFWKHKEFVISLFVDFRDIEKIGTQTSLVVAHLNNQDFQLAMVETNTLNHAVETFYNTVCFDFQNVI